MKSLARIESIGILLLALTPVATAQGVLTQIEGFPFDGFGTDMVSVGDWDGDGLFGIAGVVADLEAELLAEDAAGGVDVAHRHLGAAPHLFAKAGRHGPHQRLGSRR